MSGTPETTTMGPGGGVVGHHAAQQDPVAQMNTFRSYVSMLADPGSKDENKLKAAQALSEDLEVGVQHTTKQLELY